jgi:hypothetical protein
MTIARLILLLVATTSPAFAQGSVASKEFVVEGAGGGYEVNISPVYVTSFYFPEPVTNVLFSDKQNFVISRSDNSVVLQPKQKAPIGTSANLAVETKSLKINLILKVTKENTVGQVIFTRAEEKNVFENRVAEEVKRRLEPLQKELDERNRQLDAQVRREMARAMLRTFAHRELSRIVRTDDDVIIRVTRSIRAGDALYLHLDVQNRRSTALVVTTASATQGSNTVPVEAFFEPPGEKQLAQVPANKRAMAIVSLPVGKLQPGKPITLRLIELDGKAISVPDVPTE